MFLYVVDELRKIVGRKVLACSQHHGLFGEQGNWSEISGGVISQLFVDRLIVGMRADAAEQKRIAVWRSIHDAVHPDDACGTGRILDDHLLAEDFAHTGRKDSSHDVESTSRGKRYHHGDRS